MLLVQKIEQSCYHIKTTYSYHMDIHAKSKRASASEQKLQYNAVPPYST